VFGTLAIGVLVPFNDPGLNAALDKGESGAAASPWVAAIVNAGIDVLPHIINAVILTSAWSSGNSFMYAASRNLYSLAITGNAPKIFAMCTKRGIPIYSVCAIFICSSLSFMVVSKSNTTATVFSWFMTVNTLSSLFNWLTLFLATLRFRKAYLSRGISPTDLPFHSPFMPYAAYYGVGMVIFFILISGFDSFFDFNSTTFVENYCGVLLFLVPYLGHKAVAYFVWKERMCKPEEIDIFTGKAEVDEYERLNPPPEPRNRWEKIWFAIA